MCATPTAHPCAANPDTPSTPRWMKNGFPVHMKNQNHLRKEQMIRLKHHPIGVKDGKGFHSRKRAQFRHSPGRGDRHKKNCAEIQVPQRTGFQEKKRIGKQTTKNCREIPLWKKRPNRRPNLPHRPKKLHNQQFQHPSLSRRRRQC